MPPCTQLTLSSLYQRAQHQSADGQRAKPTGPADGASLFVLVQEFTEWYAGEWLLSSHIVAILATRRESIERHDCKPTRFVVEFETNVSRAHASRLLSLTFSRYMLNNSLAGTIPTQIGQLTALEYL